MNRLVCGRMERLISRALDNELPESESRRLAAHLEQCPACRVKQEAFVAQRRDVARSLSAAAASSAPVAGTLARRAFAAWNAEQQSSVAPSAARPSYRPALLWGTATATAAAMSCAGLFLYLRTGNTAQQGVGTGSVAAVAARPAGAQKTTAPVTAIAPSRTMGGSGTAGANILPAAADRSESPSHLASIFPRRNSGNEGTAARTAQKPKEPLIGVPGPTLETGGGRGDLAYVNADLSGFARRWTNLPPDETARLEEELRRSVRGGDSFVEVPLPRLAGVGNAGAAAAIAAYRQERAVVDARLQRKVSIAAKGTAFSDLCEKLTKETGVTFAAARSVADDKVTLFCKDRPVRDIMRAVTSVWGFTWERSGEEGAYTYRLVQPLRSQLLEEELRNRDRNEALLALDKEMERYREYLHLSPEEAHEMAKNASSPEQKKMLESLAGSGWGPARLYFGLSPDEMAALRSGQPLRFGAGDKGAALPIPDGMGPGILQSQSHNTRIDARPGGDVGLQVGDDTSKMKGVPPSDFAGAQPMAELRLGSNELGQFSLAGFSGVAVDTGNSKAMSMFGDDLAVGISPSVRDPKNAEANRALASESGLRQPVTFPAAAAAAAPKTDGDKPQRPSRVTSADLLEAVHRATGKDVIGDYYTKLYGPEILPGGKAASLFDALNRASDAMRLRWNRENDFLTFRSASFFNDRLKEVPNRLLERWAMSRKSHGGALTLDDLLEISQLTNAQLESRTMAEGARLLYGLEEWGAVTAPNLRDHWRFLASLPASLRQAALGANGLTFEQLPLAQQQQFALLTFGRNSEPPPTLADLAGATMQVTFAPRTDKERAAAQQQKPQTRPAAAADAPVEDAPGRRRPAGGGPDAQNPVVKFTYRYGGPNTGVRVKELTPGGSSIRNDGPRARENVRQLIDVNQ